MSRSIIREVIYDVIDGERDYQDALPPTRTDGHPRSVGDYLVMLDEYGRRAKIAWTDNPGDEQALDVVRKIAGIAVHCMEDHGAPRREVTAREADPEEFNGEAAVKAVFEIKSDFDTNLEKVAREAAKRTIVRSILSIRTAIDDAFTSFVDSGGSLHDKSIVIGAERARQTVVQLRQIMKEAIGRVAPIANEVGVSVDELSAGFSSITIGGVKASEAATQLRSTLAGLLDRGYKVGDKNFREILREMAGE